MRVLAGRLKGRRIDFGAREGLRPTSDKVREAVFDVIRARCADARVLDLYCGTGAMGIEALSAGAASAAFVDSDPVACRRLRENLLRLGVDSAATIRRADALDQADRFASAGMRFDLVFLDPPYGQGLAQAGFERVARADLCASGGLVVVETRKSEPAPAPRPEFECVRERLYGDTCVRIYRRNENFQTG